MKIRKSRVVLPVADDSCPRTEATRYSVVQYYGEEIYAGYLEFTDEFMENCVAARKIIAESLVELRASIRREVSIKAGTFAPQASL